MPRSNLALKRSGSRRLEITHRLPAGSGQKFIVLEEKQMLACIDEILETTREGQDEHN
jgi:hypothetical protein